MSDSSGRAGIGRPGGDRGTQPIPRGIEVLVKKASVDPAFRQALLEKRAAAAAEIGLELSATEAAMLDSVPRSQIEQIVQNTTVPDEHRRVFLGKIAAAMVALLALPLSSEAWQFQMTGSRPDTPPPRPTRPIPGMANIVVPPRPRERLKVTISDQGKNTAIVKVNYDCPYDTGEIMIVCGCDRGGPRASVTCHPERAPVSKGAGEAVFSVEGKGGITQGILVRLRDTSAPAQSKRTLADHMTPAELQAALPDFRPGEYEADSCTIYKIVEFRKMWPS
jgi:hypothetical protein